MVAASGLSATDWPLIAVIIVLLACSAFLAMAETSLVRTSTVKARSLVAEGRRGARALLGLVEHPERFLNPVLLLVLGCQLISATLVGVLTERWFGPIGVLIGIVFEVVVIFVVFEAVPKNWAVKNPERSALLVAPLVSAIVRFPPVGAASGVLIGLANFIIGERGRKGEDGGNVTESELLAMADEAMEEEVIETEERAFIHSIIEFGDAIVREVMVPRPDMTWVDAGVDVTSALDLALGAGFSRVPACQGGPDDVVGVAFAKDLIRVEHQGKGADQVRAHLRPAHFVPETKRLSGLLREMQDEKYHLSIVVDEYGGTVGLVTLEDLIEELVGEIVDEFDVDEPQVQRLPDGSVVVSGGTALGEVEEIVDTQLPQGPWDTIGGLVFDRAGRVPRAGESVEVDGLRLVVEQVKGRRIDQVRIVPTAPPARREPRET